MFLLICKRGMCDSKTNICFLLICKSGMSDYEKSSDYRLYFNRLLDNLFRSLFVFGCLFNGEYDE